MPATPVVSEVDNDWLSVDIAPGPLIEIRLPAMPYWNRGSRRKRHRYKPKDIKQRMGGARKTIIIKGLCLATKLIGYSDPMNDRFVFVD
jgi:hypothetical protein